MYGLSDGNMGPKYKFGSGSRGKQSSNDTPGPGQYYVPVSFANTLQNPYHFV